MATKLKVSIKRVCKGDEEGMPVFIGAFSLSKIDRDGFLVKSNDSVCPSFISDEDIESAKRARESKGRSVYVDASDWREQEETNGDG